MSIETKRRQYKDIIDKAIVMVEFNDVVGVDDRRYPLVELTKGSEPITVTLIVPDGYYMVKDCSEE